MLTMVTFTYIFMNVRNMLLKNLPYIQSQKKKKKRGMHWRILGHFHTLILIFILNTRHIIVLCIAIHI